MLDNPIDVSFVVPCYNATKTIALCLDSLLKQSRDDLICEIIVVDNNSTDDLQRVLSPYLEKVTLVIEKQQGRSYARNLGLKLAKGEVVAFIDADVYLENDWAESLYEIFKSDQQVIASQGQIRPCMNFGSASLNQFRFHGVEKETAGSFILTSLIRYEWPMINSAACMYRRRFLNQTGGFDIGLERHEDIDLSRRAFFSGHKIHCSTSAVAFVIFHGESWFDYMCRSFADGFYKVSYLDKWRHIEAPYSGKAKSAFPKEHQVKTKSLKYWLQKKLMNGFNLIGRLVGFLSYRRRTNWLTPEERKKGQVLIDGQSLL